MEGAQRKRLMIHLHKRSLERYDSLVVTICIYGTTVHGVNIGR